MTGTGSITPVILSGGAGTRLWPLSTPERPKQFLPLLGDETMLQATLRRVADAAAFNPPLIIASAAHRQLLEEQLASAAITPSAILLEPCARNTAPAIALAALIAQPEDLLLVMPSDHAIDDVASFRRAVDAAAPLAQEGWIVTFGIEPDRPETGYGYIKRGGELAPGAYAVERFVEKPDLDAAGGMLAEGGYGWNGGIFLFRASDMLEALASHAPEILDAVRRSLGAHTSVRPWVYPDAAAFGASPSDSIDYAVMEKAEKVAVVPVDMGWSDVGSWDALYDILAKDTAGNSSSGEVVALDSGGCLLRGEGAKVVSVGTRDLIVIATAGEVLVVPRGRSQDIKQAVARLQPK